jgi:hypothetical protein
MPRWISYPVLVPAVAPYVGPGDIVSGATAWWGLRAYSLATAGTKAINIRASGDNATTDINTLANGNLDVATVSSFLTTHGGSAFIAKKYDQTGNGNDQAQATAANQPALILSAIGSLPMMQTTAANSMSMSSSSFTVTDSPLTISTVINFTNLGAQQSFVDRSGTPIQVGASRAGAADTVFMYAGGLVPTATVTGGAFHALQWRFDNAGATSSVYVDGTNTAMALGNAQGASVSQVDIGAYVPSASQYTSAYYGEVGIWSGTAFTTAGGGQCSQMNSNQRNYWGF